MDLIAILEALFDWLKRFWEALLLFLD